ncbi:hypothetical protein EZV62_021861 [Acer yangbiense]|uniref:Ternary complex factor MIP1 leucine-zipper domain-containing protein n=1 Tax=Acer yangbiense TaxID=1000413 RepID=A0A5C7H861_9ROSI|nr:hypothetical protein EZV62_021861 [Acer yangbiense]
MMQNFNSGSNSTEKGDESRVSPKLSSSSLKNSLPQHNEVLRSKSTTKKSENKQAAQANESTELLQDVSTETSSESKSQSNSVVCKQKSTTIANRPAARRRPTIWGRTAAKKNLSMESIDYPIEEEAEIENLEATKFDLENKIADEVETFRCLFLGILLEKRKKALNEHRLALEKDVARLQEQLQKERDKRTALESALNTSRGSSLYIPSTIDEETKVELKEISQTEAEVTNLKQKLDDLGVQLNEQLQKNHGSVGDSSNQLQQASAKLKDKQKDSEVAATSHGFEKSTIKQNTNQDGATESENEKKRDSVNNSNSKSTVSTNSKKSGSRGEGGNSTSSALTKLTNRLNFLKERRSQIASELQNMDKSRGSGQAVRSQDKGSDVQSVSHSDGSQSQQNLERGVGTEDQQALQSSEKFRKSHSHSNVDEGRKTEGERPQHLDRGRSEGNDPTKLVITYGGKWVGNFYEGGETEFLKVHKNLTYDELLRVVQGVANVDLRRFTIDLRTLVDTGVRLRPARPKIKDDSDVEMLLCDDQHVPEVYVSVVEKVSAEPGHVGVPTVQPIYQTFSQQLAAQFPSAGGSNNVWGSIPTTDPSFDQTVNPIILEDQTIDEVVEEPYNEDDRSIPEYIPHSEYGLDDFNEDYIRHSGSREGVNDEPAYDHGMGSDPTGGGGCTGFVPPVSAGPSRDAFEDDGVNVADMSGNVVPRP